MRRLLAVLTVLGSLLALTACGDEEPDAGATGPVTIEITFEGHTVTPAGDRIEVGLGQEVELEVKADAPGTVHVHSTPEQELDYDAGTTLLQLGAFDRAGVYEVETHALHKTIVQLEVR